MGTTNIQIKEIYSLGPFRVGWQFYPITFKGENCVVELKCNGLGFSVYPSHKKVVVKGFKYQEKKKLFGGSKGELVFARDITSSCYINSKDGLTNIWKFTPDVLKFFLPKIMEKVFHSLESEKKTADQNSKCKFCEQLEWRDYLIPARNQMDTDNLCQCLSWGRIDGSVETGPLAEIYCPEDCGGCADNNEYFGLFTYENRMGFSYHFKSQNLRIDRNSQMLTINFCPWCGRRLSEKMVDFEKSCLGEKPMKIV